MVWRLVHNFGLELEKEYHHFSSLLPFPSLPLAHLVFGFAFFPAHCVALWTDVSFCPTMFFYFDSLMEKEGPTRPDFDFRISIKSYEIQSRISTTFDKNCIEIPVLPIWTQKKNQIEKLFAKNQRPLNFCHEFQARELKSRLFHSVFGSWQ